MGQFLLVSCEEGCCPSVKRVEEALGQYGVSLTRTRLGTLAGVAMRLRHIEGALFAGEGAGLPVLLLIDEETGEKIWVGENPSELEIAKVVYLAGNYL